MSKRLRCFYCGRGLSQKHRIDIETRLLLAIFNKASICCIADAEKVLEVTLTKGELNDTNSNR